MDRAQLVLLGLPLFLFCTDLLNFFTPPPPPPHKPPHHHHPHLQHQHQPPPVAKETLEFPSQKPSAFGAIGVGSTVKISFCTSCSYKGNAVTMTKMLEASFPGIHVELSNYPPPLPKRLVSKLVPVAQVGVFGIIMAGEGLIFKIQKKKKKKKKLALGPCLGKKRSRPRDFWAVESDQASARWLLLLFFFGP
ncbi:selT-like protein isoform X1 [Pyrus communis]|uniref:selT-like protein isoform X1 n=1 Tax=Pyrus communis TaxID=23211 RepID=UPI0035BF2200